jgi:hypothetical protein
MGDALGERAECGYYEVDGGGAAYPRRRGSARCLDLMLDCGGVWEVLPKRRVGRSTLGTSTELGFLYILNPLSLMNVVTADMMRSCLVDEDESGFTMAVCMDCCAGKLCVWDYAQTCLQ